MPNIHVFSLLKQRQSQRDRYQLLLLLVGLILILLTSLCAGERWLWPWQWLESTSRLFVWQLRLPRALAVMAVGASLALAGAVMQSLFENPLAEPGLLGIANGAGLALVVTLVAGHATLSGVVLSSSAVVGAQLITLLLLTIARRRLTNTRLLLIGVALGMACSAVMTWMVYFSSTLDLRQLMYWMMGGFGGIDWWQVGWVVALLPAVIWLCCQGRALNLIALGEVTAVQLGLPLSYWRYVLVLVIGWLVGISVALAGVIGFVGLVVPHMLRLSGLTDQRYLLSGCALAGAALLLLADIIARIALFSAELPIGVVTATLGVPLFIWLLTRATNFR